MHCLSQSVNQSFLPLPLSLVVCGEIVKEFRVCLHKGFEDVKNKSNDSLIPVFLGDAIQGRKHDRHDGRTVFLN